MRFFTFVLFIFSSFISLSQIQGPGSGNCLQFNGSNTIVTIPDDPSFDHPGNTITMEAWVNPSSYTSNHGCIFSKSETDLTREYDLFVMSNGTVRFGLFADTDVPYITLTTAIVPLNTWTHLAATYSAASGIARVYFNGILVTSNNIGPITIQSTSIRPLIGAYWLFDISSTARSFFSGAIDEVRLWHSERTLTEIRANMCRTLDVPQADLVAYYRLDEPNGLDALDASGNGNNGTLRNFLIIQTNDWNFSAAPIGNASVYQYPAGGILSLGSTPPGADDGTLIVENIAGNPAGFHLYRVDALPSQTGGLVDPIDTYFGTFAVGGTSPSYRALYDYDGSPLDNTNCEYSYELFQRNDNSVATWIPLPHTLNTIANTLTAGGVTARREIILDTFCSTLPVDLIYFNGSPLEEGVHLRWGTTSEKDNDHFVLEKSQDPHHFEPIGKINGQAFSENLQTYEFTDNNSRSGLWYYRLKQVDKDGGYRYSKICMVRLDQKNAFSIYPTAGRESFIIKVYTEGNWKLLIRNIKGQEIYFRFSNLEQEAKEFYISALSQAPPGIYIVEFYSDQGLEIQKLIVY